jgi:hypothetical protein
MRKLLVALAVMFSTMTAVSAHADSIITFGPSMGWSDSPFAFGGSLTFSGSTLVSWDLQATCPACNPNSPPTIPGTNYIYEWTPTNSIFSTDSQGFGYLFSADGTETLPKAWVGVDSNYQPPVAQLQNGDYLAWNYLVTWAYGGVGANAAAGVTVTAVPEPDTYAMLLAGLFVVGFQVRRKLQMNM